MYKHSKSIAMTISIVMALSLLLSPISVAGANAPIRKPPVKTPANGIPIGEPAAKPQIYDTPAIKELEELIPSLSESTVPLSVRKEIPAKVKGVTYKLKEDVEVLPSDIDYELEQISLEELASFESAAKATEGTTGEKGIQSAPKQKGDIVDFNKINGLKHAPGSKFMVLNKNLTSSVALEKNKIYLDKEQGLAYRVLEEERIDQDGNSQYVVDSPNMTEVFESYKIPAQDIKLTTGNIAYMAPGVELDPRSGMHSNYYASGGGYISGYKHEGNKHILNLTANKMIFQYPSSEDENKTKEEKEKAAKEKFKGDWWENEKGTDLKGFESEDELKISVAIKKGTIIIEDPTFHADFDFNWLTTHVGADFYFESKTIADVTFEGDVSINKSMEACIFGYDIDLGSLMGREKGNRAYVGIFLVIGANGKVHVEVRTTSTGNARAGYEYKAFAYGFLPYSVGPYVRYRPTGFDASFTLDGEIHMVMACVPQVGVIIWGCEIGALQIWLGYKADAVFSASGGGGKGSAEINAFTEMIGILFNKKYTIFHLDFPIYKGEWVIGEEVSGDGGDSVKNVSPSFFVKADASTNIVEGKIAYGGHEKPFANKKYAAEIWETGKTRQLKATLPGTTDEKGNFKIGTGAYNLIPADTVFINIEQPALPGFSSSQSMEEEANQYFADGESIYRLTATKSKAVYPTVPFTSLDFDVDAFNDAITGTVSGQYTGPVDLIVEHYDGKNTEYVTNATNGVFSEQVPIDKSVLTVRGEINFEGTVFPQYIVYRKPNLDALDINIFNEFEESQNNEMERAVGDTIKKPATNNFEGRITKRLPISKTAKKDVDDEGNIIVRSSRIIGTITNRGEMGDVKAQGEDYTRDSGSAAISAKPFQGSIKVTSVPIVQGLLKAIEDRDGSRFTDPIASSRESIVLTAKAQPVIIDGRTMAGSTFEFVKPELLAYKLEIEHDGLIKTIEYNPFKFHYDTSMQDMIRNVNQYANRSVQKEATLTTENKIDAIVNPGINMNIINAINQGSSMRNSSIATPGTTANQWDAKWNTEIGIMELTQNGNAVSGHIMQGGIACKIEGTISNGVFKGGIMIPSVGSLFGDIVTVEMSMSTDGKSISFKNINGEASVKRLNGTKANRQ